MFICTLAFKELNGIASPLSQRPSPKALSMCGCVCMYVSVHVCVCVYMVRVIKGGLKACVCLHVSAFICVCKCMRVYLCVTGGLKLGSIHVQAFL